MEEPTKSDIDAIFKRLKTLPANKVSWQMYLISELDFSSSFSFRFVSIVRRKIPPGHRSLTAFSSASIVRQGIGVSAFICRSFVQRTSIPVGDGFNFGTLIDNRLVFDLSLFCSSQRYASWRQCQCGKRSSRTSFSACSRLIFSGLVFSTTRLFDQRHSAEIQQSSSVVVPRKASSVGFESDETIRNKSKFVR